MKKILALVLALMLVLGMTSAFAATITINNVVNGQTYTAYKLLNYTHDEDDDAYAYYLTKAEYDTGLGAQLEEAGFEFSDLATDNRYYVTNADGLTDGAALATAIKGVDLSHALATVQVTAANDSATFGNLATGYYYVTSTTGTLLSLGTFDAETVVFDKNEGPGLDKEITGINDADSDHIAGDAESADAKIGDTINYTVTITARKGAENYIFHDQHSAGLTYLPDTLEVADLTENEDYTIVRNSATAAVAADVTANADVKLGDNITIRFTKDYLDTITADTDITITYSAVLNDNAVIDSDGNPNTVKLQYGHTESTEDSPTTPGPDEREDENIVYTYAIAIKKVNTVGLALPGVTFTFPFKTKTVDGKEYYMYDSTSTTSDTSTLTTDAAGQITVVGVDAGTYSIAEATTLEGYNVLTEPVEITAQLIHAERTTVHFYIDENGNETQDVTGTDVIYDNDDVAATAVMAVNRQGAVLPSTGGIGTTLFYVGGGILVLLAVILLVTKKRMSSND